MKIKGHNMKNIIIGGTVRSGKSTLANKIAKKFNYSLCESDTIVNAFDEVFPELGIVHNKPESAREKYKPFLFEILNGFYRSLKYLEIVTIFPGAQFLPRHIAEYPKLDKYIVIFLGINDCTPEELVKKFRKWDKPSDWTFKESDEKLLKHAEKIINESIKLEIECKKYGFYYFNTFHDREKTFDEVLKLIETLQN